MLTSDQQADRIASRQHATISHAQARQCGLTNKQIWHRVQCGRWRRPLRGVYVVAGSPDTWQQRLMVCLLAVPEGVASHLSAAAVHGLWRPPPLPHILVPPSHSARTRHAKVHRSLLGPGDLVTADGIRCTSPTRTIVDIASMLSRRYLADVVDDAFCQQLSCIEAVRRVFDRVETRGRRGMPLLLEVVEAWSPGITPGSAAEMRLLRQLMEWGYDPPEQQVRICLPDGTFVGRADLAWRPRCVGFEYDSDRWHSPRRWERDEGRYAGFRAAGWRILPVSKRDLLPSSDLRERVARAVRSAAA